VDCRNNKLLGLMIGAWQVYVCERRNEKQRVWDTKCMHNANTLRSGWSSWISSVAVNNRGKVVAHNSLHNVKSAVWSIWRLTMLAKQDEDSKVEMCRAAVEGRPEFKHILFRLIFPQEFLKARCVKVGI